MAGQRLTWVDAAVGRIESGEQLDGLAEAIDAVTGQLDSGAAAEFLRGDWLGHALHPLMTDFPLGCWIGAGLLDLLAGESGREASRRLVGLGLLAAPLTIAAGLAEWRMLDSAVSRRVAAVHASGNLIASFAYLRSWQRRRQGHHAAGVTWAMIGGLTAIATGYLGGHLSFVRTAGTGARGRPAIRGGPASALRRLRSHSGWGAA